MTITMTMDAANLTADALMEARETESLRPVVSTRRVTITSEDGHETDESAGSPLLKSLLTLLGAGAVLAGAMLVNPPAATEAKAAAPAPVLAEAPEPPAAKPVVTTEPAAVAPKQPATAPIERPNTSAKAAATKARRAPAITPAASAEPAAPPPLENPY